MERFGGRKIWCFLTAAALILSGCGAGGGDAEAAPGVASGAAGFREETDRRENAASESGAGSPKTPDDTQGNDIPGADGAVRGPDVSPKPSGSSGLDTGNNARYDTAYEAYADKCLQLRRQYGDSEIVEAREGGGKTKFGCCYMKGLCMTSLINFNEDRLQDLLVVYSQGENTGLNMVDVPIPQAGNYCVEVWTYEEEQLKLLMSSDHVSSYLHFNTEYWNTDNCYLTVYEYEEKALIQIYEQVPEGEVFKNYCYPFSLGGSEPECSVYTAKDGKFYENGEEIPEPLWYTRVGGYETILAGIQLSSSEYDAGELAAYGIDMSYGPERSEKIEEGLNKDIFRSFPAISGEYFPAYMETVLKIRREVSAQAAFDFREPEFALYDMDGNGVPELIVNIGGAGSQCRVYTWLRDEAVLCGERNSGHGCFYTGPEGGMVFQSGHMDVYAYEKWDLQGTELVATRIAEGRKEPAEEYPPLSDYGYGEYEENLLCFWSGELSTLLYLSGLECLPCLRQFEEAASVTADTEYRYVYEDLNRDGEKELLAVVAGESGYQAWYAAGGGVPCEMVWEGDYLMDYFRLEPLRLEESTHVAVNAYNMMGDAKYYSILAPEDGGIKCLVADNWGYVYRNRYGDIVMDVEAYDGTYQADLGFFVTHTWKDAYLYYDGKTYREYGGTALTEEEFVRRYGNGVDILEGIRQDRELSEGENLEFTAFFVRENGIAQIQCEHKYADNSIDFFYYELREDGNGLLSGGLQANAGQMRETLSALEATYPGK